MHRTTKKYWTTLRIKRKTTQLCPPKIDQVLILWKKNIQLHKKRAQLPWTDIPNDVYLFKDFQETEILSTKSE